MSSKGYITFLFITVLSGLYSIMFSEIPKAESQHIPFIPALKIENENASKETIKQVDKNVGNNSNIFIGEQLSVYSFTDIPNNNQWLDKLDELSNEKSTVKILVIGNSSMIIMENN